MGQYDLLGALEVKLGHNDLIRDISPMRWKLKVQLILNYSLGMDLQVYINLGHNDLLRDLAVKV